MSSGSEYRTSPADGLPARVSGAWAREKLEYLTKYMSIFNVGMKNKWERVYLDLLAGQGDASRPIQEMSSKDRR